MLYPMPDTTIEPVTVRAGHRAQAIATLHSVADSFAKLPFALLPQSVDMVRHNVTLTQFVAFADEHGAKIQFGKAGARWVTAELATAALHAIEVKMTLFLDPMHIDAREDEAFRTHNAECVITEGA